MVLAIFPGELTGIRWFSWVKESFRIEPHFYSLLLQFLFCLVKGCSFLSENKIDRTYVVSASPREVQGPFVSWSFL